MKNIIPVYCYACFYDIASKKAGDKLADFLNEHPDIEIVKLEFADTVSGSGVVSTTVHLLYKE